MPKVYSVGYGGRKPERLIAVLKEHGIGVVIDVRQQHARAYSHAYWSDAPMKNLLLGYGIEYVHAHELGKDEEVTLDEYSEWLEAKTGSIGVYAVARLIENHEDTRYCLLCAEKNAYWLYPPMGIVKGSVKCHRVHAANAIVKLLGGEWEVEHL